MSQESTPILLNTNYSHPIASCNRAKVLYYAWTFVAEIYKKGSEQYEEACLRYKWHLAECQTCQKGLGK